MRRKQQQKRQPARPRTLGAGGSYSDRALERAKRIQSDGDEEPRDRYFRRDMRAKA